MPLGDPADVDISSLRIAYYSDVDGYQRATDDTQATLSAAVTALAELVQSVEQDAPPPISKYVDLWARVGGGDGRAWVDRMLEKWGTTEVSPFIEQGFARTEPTTTAEYTAALEAQDQFRSEMLGWVQDYDAVVAPVASQPAPTHGATYEGDNRTMFYTGPYNITGWPGAVVRCGTSAEGLPIGVQILAKPWREDICLALAAALESALGGWQRPSL